MWQRLLNRPSFPRRLLDTALAAALLLTLAKPAAAQPAATVQPASASSTATGGWHYAVYPILAWIPVNISVDLNIPIEGGGSVGGSIENASLDGAFVGGFGASNGTWRFDAEGLWAAFGGNRIDRPPFSVDIDAIYGSGTVGHRLGRHLFVVGGFRRLALKYDISLPDRAPLERKPGFWDPIAGLAFHREARRFELHGYVQGGGFGVGSDYEIAAGGRAEWKPWSHFGLTGGYGLLVFKVSDTVAGQLLEATQNLNGPVVGVGLYF